MGVGRAAEPEIFSRRFPGDIALREPVFVSSSRSECASIRRVHIVGTAVKNVMGFRSPEAFDKNGAASRFQTASVLNG